MVFADFLFGATSAYNCNIKVCTRTLILPVVLLLVLLVRVLRENLLYSE
jgi:hypothetical protein